jgi:ADP-heptose:LPS heptosyltransferase
VARDRDRQLLAVTSARPRLVVLRALKLGDFLAAVPALRALARAFPDHERTLATPAWLEPLARHVGVVDRLIDTPELGRLQPSLEGADVAVNLHGAGPQSTAILAATGPARLISFGLAGGPAWLDQEHERERWCRLLRESGIPADADDLHLPVPDVEPPHQAVGATLVHPGASSGSRRWPPERWAAIARAQAAEGRPVVITGDAGERGLALDVARRAGLDDDVVLAGRTDLLGLLAAVGASDRVVCADTGVAHVASALGISSVVLFGPTDPALWGPPAAGPHVVLWQGRTGDPHATETDPGLLALSVDQVRRALDACPRP